MKSSALCTLQQHAQLATTAMDQQLSGPHIVSVYLPLATLRHCNWIVYMPIVPTSFCPCCSFKKLLGMMTDAGSAFHTCLRDDLDYIGVNRTLDPKLLDWLVTQRQLAAATAAALAAADASPDGTALRNETVTIGNISMTQEQYAEFTARLPPYTGMPHPPPASNNPECDGKPWSAPFLPTYGGPMHPFNTTGDFHLTQCNYYLPAGPAVAGIHR